MYRYDLTDAISKDLDRVALLRERLDNRGALPRRWLGRLRRDLEAESVAASTIMEGVRVTVDEVRRLLAGDSPSGVTELDASLVLGYRDAMSYVLRRADDPALTWQAELIHYIHDRTMGGSFALGAGRFRTRAVYIADGRSAEPIYTAPDHGLVADLVDELTAFMQGAIDTPAPILSALAHVRLAGIHPFGDGNGRTARIVASFVMCRAGYRAPEFTSLEEWWGRHRAEYYAAFACLGKTWDDSVDVTPFVTTHVAAQRRQADALSLRLSAQRALWDVIEEIAGDAGLDLRAANALWEAFFRRSVTNRYYRGLVDVSKATAAVDLVRLTSAGLLSSKGAGRDTEYTCAGALYATVARVAGLDEVARLGNPAEDMPGIIVSSLADRLVRQDELLAREHAAGWGTAAR